MPLQQNGGTKSTLIIGATISFLIIAITGCVISPDNPDESNENSSEPENSTSLPKNPEGLDKPEAIASSISTSTNLGDLLQLDVHALEKVGEGLLRLHIELINNSNENFRIYDALSDPKEPYTASRITLIDTENQTRHLRLSQSDGSCFCLPFEDQSTIPPQGSMETWIIFPAPPENVESMVVTTPITPPLLDVPITESSETIENSGIAEPEILDLTSISDSLEDQTGRTENNEEVSILLSSDVLFETNSSELNPDAQEVLEQVATEINNASATTVNIDGHADDTGDDSVNIPLSQERAVAVEEALGSLLTRSDVTFSVEGHGSADPIADNETEEGRERNRRVSVTFEK